MIIYVVIKMFRENKRNNEFEYKEFKRVPHHHPSYETRRSFRRHPPAMSPIHISREDFKEIKHFFILSIIIDKENGINGYQLQEQYKIPRGSMIRSLEELEQAEYLNVKETTIEGRDQKIYCISEKGKQYLEQLKEKWANEFAMMSDMAPPEEYAHPFARRPHRMEVIRFIERCESKEDALDYFRGMRSKLKRSLKRLNSRIKNTTQIKEELDSIIISLEKMDSLDKNMLKELLQDIKNNIRKERL
jgi:DNA-binding MarR family transcriptional regulator